MATTIYNKLENLINGGFKVNGVRKGSKEYVAMTELLCRGIATTGFSSKRGKDIWTGRVYNYLTIHGFKCEKGNDAPRGGANGEYVKIVSPAFQKEVKERALAEQKRRENERAIAEAKAAAHKAHIAELAKAIDINIYKADIDQILKDIDYIGHSYGQEPTLNRWGRGQVIYRLSQKYHINCEVLGVALQDYKLN